MEEKKKKKRLIQKLKSRYRLIIYNDSTYQTVWSMRLSRMKVFTLGGLLAFVLIMLTTFFIAYTPFREFIPGYPSPEVRQTIVRNAILLDSLEYQLQIRDAFIHKFKTIMRGEVPYDTDERADSAFHVSQVHFQQYRYVEKG